MEILCGFAMAKTTLETMILKMINVWGYKAWARPKISSVKIICADNKRKLPTIFLLSGLSWWESKKIKYE